MSRLSITGFAARPFSGSGAPGRSSTLRIMTSAAAAAAGERMTTTWPYQLKHSGLGTATKLSAIATRDKATTFVNPCSNTSSRNRADHITNTTPNAKAYVTLQTTSAAGGASRLPWKDAARMPSAMLPATPVTAVSMRCSLRQAVSLEQKARKQEHRHSATKVTV